MQVHEAAENYLETILILSNQKTHVRSIDIANELNYSKPTISIVMKQFRENGYIQMDTEGYITLTEKGKTIADRMFERHEIIAKILMSLGVDEETAYKDSCKIEHDISDLSFECMKNHFLKHRHTEDGQHE